jgi:hypothetical protein
MNNQPSPPAQTQLAYESVNEGSSWRVGNVPPPQPPQDVSAVVGERFAWHSGPDLYMLTGHGWRVSLVNPGYGFSLVGFETDRQGVALGTKRLSVGNPQRSRQLEPGHHLTDPRCGPVPT